MSSCQTKNLKEKKHNKIRKRGSSSTSSSSTFTRKYRFKRAILVAKKSGYSTPSPMWKTTSMSTNHHHNHAIKNTSLHSSKEKKEISVSARKLAATLWELNDLTPSMVKKEPMRINKDRDKDRVQSLCRSVLLGPHKLDPSYSSTSFSEKESNKLKDKRNCGKCKVGVKNYLKEAKSGLSTLNRLLKVLSQMVHEEKHSFRSIPLILGMSNELDRVRNQIDGFIEEQSSNQNDIEYLMKHFAEENSAWKRREREKIRATMMSLTRELEVEKKLRRQTERLNMKIVNEMENVKYFYSKLSKEHKREKRAKEILEQVCDELAQGIGEDRAKVEEMKRESEKVLEEVEKEREMLQLADVLREERVHMKLSEAKYQFEEKNEMLENLRNELESFFKSKEKEKGGDDDGVNEGLKKLKDFEFYLNKTCLELQNLEADNHLNVGDAIEHEDESAETESDLQSIELNMDNENKSYNWSYACENVAHFEAKRVSIDKDIGRRSFSDWGSICFNKGTPKGNKQKEFGLNIDESFDKLERERSIEFVFGDEIEKDKKESENYRTIMSLRDTISLTNLAKESDQSIILRCVNGEVKSQSSHYS